MIKHYTSLFVLVSIGLSCILAGCGGSTGASTVSSSSSQSQQPEVSVASAASDEEKAESPDEAKKVKYAQDCFAELMDNEKYQNGSDDERYSIINDMLLSLEKDGYIKNVYYAEDSKLFTFKYADGVLGGIYLDSFAAKPGEIPMN